MKIFLLKFTRFLPRYTNVPRDAEWRKWMIFTDQSERPGCLTSFFDQCRQTAKNTVYDKYRRRIMFLSQCSFLTKDTFKDCQQKQFLKLKKKQTKKKPKGYSGLTAVFFSYLIRAAILIHSWVTHCPNGPVAQNNLNLHHIHILHNC